MVGNNGNSDMRCTLAITGARRLRPAVKEGRAPGASVNAGSEQGRKTRDGIATKHGRRRMLPAGFVHLEVEAQLYQAHFLDGR